MARDIYESHYYDLHFRAVMNAAQQVKVFTDKNTFVACRTLSFDTDSTDISSVDYFAGAVISSLLSALAEHCRRRRTVAEELEGTIQLQLANPLTLAGVKGREAPPWFSHCKLTVYACLSPEPDNFPAFCRQALLLCPLYQTLQKATQVEVDFKPLI